MTTGRGQSAVLAALDRAWSQRAKLKAMWWAKGEKLGYGFLHATHGRGEVFLDRWVSPTYIHTRFIGTEDNY